MFKSNAVFVGLLALFPIAAYYLANSDDHSSPHFFLYAIAVWFLLLYLFGPIHIHRTQWSALEPDFKPFDPRGPESPPEVSEYYGEVERELAGLGFDPLRSYSTRNSSPNASGFVILFRNAGTSEVAKIIAAVAVSGPVRNVSALLVFSTEFADGTEVVTSNNRSPRIHPPRRSPFHGFVFPEVREAGRLLEIHHALVRRFEDGRIRIDPVSGDPDGYLSSREFHRPLANHVECGYYYRDEDAGVQRPTWKGAILMTWKLLWPAKPIRFALRCARARRLLRKLEAESGGWL